MNKHTLAFAFIALFTLASMSDSAQGIISQPGTTSKTIRGVAVKDEPLCFKHTAGEDQNRYVRIASRISKNDIRFLALLDAENGLWALDRGSPTNDWGACQINRYYHPKIVNDPRFFTDAEWQIGQCWKLYKSGTKFYADKNIWKTKKNFTCP